MCKLTFMSFSFLEEHLKLKKEAFNTLEEYYNWLEEWSSNNKIYVYGTEVSYSDLVTMV